MFYEYWGFVTTCPQFSQNREDTPLTAEHDCDLQGSISGYHYPWLKQVVSAVMFLEGKVISGLRDHSRIVLQEGNIVALKPLHLLPTAPYPLSAAGCDPPRAA